MAEIAPSGGGPNRLFVVLAIGLAGLLILGLLAVGGFLLIPRLLGGGAPTARAALTPTRQIVLATVAPTNTLAPTEIPTPTLVNAASAQGTETPTESPTGGQLPQSGLGEDMLLLAGGVVLVMVVFAARRARTA